MLDPCRSAVFNLQNENDDIEVEGNFPFSCPAFQTQWKTGLLHRKRDWPNVWEAFRDRTAIITQREGKIL